MKILIIDTAPVAGGAEIYLLRLVEFLSKKHQLHLLLSTQNPLTSSFQNFASVFFLNTGESLERWRGLNLFCNCKVNVASIRPLLKKKFDLVLLGGYLKDLFLFNNSFNLPKIFISHTMPPKWLLGWPFKDIFAKACNKMDKIITVSDFNARWLSEFISKEKIVTIKNGIDIKEFSPVTAREKEKIKAELSLSRDKIILGNTSRIHKAKGQIRLVRIFKNLKRQHPNIALLLVNDGSRPAKWWLKKEIKCLGLKSNIFWFSFQSDVTKFYKVMDIFALSSLSENFPLTVLEAMASGLPVVAFNIAGIPEQIENGKTGFLVKTGDYSEFQKKLELLIYNEKLREKLGRAARIKTEKEFDQKLTFAKLEEVLKRVIKK